MQVKSINAFTSGKMQNTFKGDYSKSNFEIEPETVVKGAIASAVVIGGLALLGRKGAKIMKEGSIDPGEGIKKYANYIKEGSIDVFHRVKKSVRNFFKESPESEFKEPLVTKPKKGKKIPKA